MAENDQKDKTVEKITGLEKKCHYYEMASSLYEAVYIISNTAVFGTLIYILFKIF